MRATEAADSVTARLRTSFPALARRHNGNDVAYFDGPGGTQVPDSVVKAMSGYLREHNANTHWAYPSSAETDAMIARSRGVMASFFNCAPNEVVFGQNMTTMTFHLARALGWQWGPGDEIVVTELDHHANIAPWRILEKERGVRIRTVPFDSATGEFRMSDLGRALTPATRLIAVGAASNAIGTVNDLEEIVMMARGVDAMVFVDAVHSAPHILPDVKELDCDFLATSAYKFYGPHIGVMFVRESIGSALEVPKLEPAPSEMPERLETGTGNHEGMAGAAAAVEFLASAAGDSGSGGFDGDALRARLTEAYGGLHRRGEELVRAMWEGLRGINGVTVHGPPLGRPRTPTVAFSVKGTPSEQVARHLANDGIFASHGDFYAETVIERLGMSSEGVVRAGAACYTTMPEVERLLESVSRLR